MKKMIFATLVLSVVVLTGCEYPAYLDGASVQYGPVRADVYSAPAYGYDPAYSYGPVYRPYYPSVIIGGSHGYGYGYGYGYRSGNHYSYRAPERGNHSYRGDSHRRGGGHGRR